MMQIVLAMGLLGCRPRASDTLMVFAAASLRDALTEVGATFETETGIATSFNFAGSNVLARQLLAAPRGDVFVSAHARWMDEVANVGALDGATRRPVLSNTLVVVAAADSEWSMARLDDLATLPFRHLAMGDPAAVPAGIYARAALAGSRLPEGDTLWSRVVDRMIPAPDVRAAIALAAAQAATLGIVYQTDARATPGVRILFEVPAALTTSIRYEAAALTASRHGTLAARFVDHLESPTATAIFARHGFLAWSPTASIAANPTTP